jgi:hypothetical protein
MAGKIIKGQFWTFSTASVKTRDYRTATLPAASPPKADICFRTACRTSKRSMLGAV